MSGHGRRRPDPRPTPRAPSSRNRRNVLTAPYDDIDGTREIARAHRTEIAAILCEPVMRGIAARPGFLDGLRALADELHVPLVFDEVITGFRLGLGGAQALLRRHARHGRVRQGAGVGVPGRRGRWIRGGDGAARSVRAGRDPDRRRREHPRKSPHRRGRRRDPRDPRPAGRVRAAAFLRAGDWAKDCARHSRVAA